MKRSLYISITALLGVLSCTVSEDEIIIESTYDCQLPNEAQTLEHPDQVKYQNILDGMVSQGVPGILMTVYDGKSTSSPWVGSSGKADLKNNIDMKPCNITRVGSTVKMFTAVTVLQLVEEGKLALDEKAAPYLSKETIRDIENAETATIRQLLQHSSGIYNYIQSPHFQTASLNDLTKEWSPDELLSYARGRKANFAPGTDVDYSNTNYIFLGEIIEKVAGKPFYEVFRERIFNPLNLSYTSFATENPVPEDIIRGYIDLYSKLEVTDATYFSGWDYYAADGGLISNPYDLNVFFNSLINGGVISSSSLDEMMDCIPPNEEDTEFFPIAYGLGIFKMETPWGEAYFHSGDAIGYYANMVYFPDHETTICWAVNGNYGKIDDFTSTKEAMENIFEVVFD